MSIFKIAAFLPSIFLFGMYIATAQAQTEWIERERYFQWEIVPDAATKVDPSDPVATLEPWYVNTDLIIRRGDLVTFEALSPAAEYVEFFGHCNTTQMTSRYVGEFLTPTYVRYRPVALDWQYADSWGLALLNFACENAMDYPAWID